MSFSMSRDRVLVASVPVLLDDRGDAVAHQVGVGEARTDRVDGDAGLRRLQRQRAHQPDHRMLGGAVGDDIGVALQARGRGDRDDAAEARARSCRRARPASHAPRPCTLSSNMPRNCSGVGLARTARSRRAPALATRMSTGPRAASACFTPAFDRRRVGDVGDDIALRHRPPRPPRRSAASLRPSTVTVAPARRQRRRDGAADAASAAGHQSMPSRSMP